MILVKNIYYMLSYAFRILNEQGYKQMLTEEFDNVSELCAAILIKGISSQIKKGLNREYILQTEQLSTIKGRINIASSIKDRSILKKQLVCDYDDFSVNSYMNRIIRTTMEQLLRSNITKSRKKELRKLLLFFSEVEPLDLYSINWTLRYNRNNQTYQMLISICYLVVKGLLQTNADGTTKLMDFFDDQRMCRLYEKFILEYYKKEYPNLKVSSSQIPWNLDDDITEMLPVMQSDIMLQVEDRTLIIDAKYYSYTMQSQFNTYTLHSNNLYQIYTYVKNYDKDHTGNVSGLVLYAKTDEAILPKNNYCMDGNKIMIDTLDLNCDFETIKNKLNSVVYKLQNDL